MLTIVLPTFNEEKNPLFHDILDSFKNLKQTEVIVVDYQSKDNTLEILKNYPYRVLNSNSNGRAHRLNEGIKNAKGELILLHHPRSLIEPKGLEYLSEQASRLTRWGAFTHEFDKKHPLLRFTSFWSNYFRGTIFNVFYLDHCLFAPTKMLREINFIPEVDIFEDTLLSYELRKKSRAIRLAYKSTTSAVRFIQNGILKQAFKNQILKWKFYLGYNDVEMNKGYEKDLNLNSRYQGNKNE